MDNVLNQIGAVDPELLSEYKQNLMVGGGSPGPCRITDRPSLHPASPESEEKCLFAFAYF